MNVAQDWHLEHLDAGSLPGRVRNGPVITFILVLVWPLTAKKTKLFGFQGVGPSLLGTNSLKDTGSYSAFSHWAGSVQCVQQCVGVLSCKLLSWEQLPTVLYGESVRAKGTQPDGLVNQNN